MINPNPLDICLDSTFTKSSVLEKSSGGLDSVSCFSNMVIVHGGDISLPRVSVFAMLLIKGTFYSPLL